MRLPVRLHITWQDPNTMKVEIDAGMQTRLFLFGRPQAPVEEQPSWQGYSRADWEFSGGRGAPGQRRHGQLKVVTTRLRPGYLRKNGIPYGGNATLTEYFAVLIDDDRIQYLAITSVLEDPQYLAQPWIRTSQFKKQSSAAGWNPTSCAADQRADR
jgi:hypothetical protein